MGAADLRGEISEFEIRRFSHVGDANGGASEQNEFKRKY